MSKKTIVIISGNSDVAEAGLLFYRDRLAGHDLTIFVEHPNPVRKLAKFVSARIRSQGILSAADMVLFALFQRFAGLFRRHRSADSLPVHAVDGLGLQVAQQIAARKPDIVILNLCSLLRAEFIHALNCQIINVHPGINPRYRGAGNIWALKEDNPELVGVTLHNVDAGVDTGKVLARRLIEPVQHRMRFDEIDRAALLEGAALAVAYVHDVCPSDGVTRDLIDRFYPAAGLSTWLAARRNYRRRLRVDSGSEASQAWRRDTAFGSSGGAMPPALRSYLGEDIAVLELGFRDGSRVFTTGSGLDIGLEGADAAGSSDLSFAAGTFDATFAVDLLQHVSSAQRVVDETVRVTKIGGVVLIKTLKQPSFLELVFFTLTRRTGYSAKGAWATFKRSFSRDAGVAWRYRPSAVAAMFGSRGKVVEVRYDGLFGTRFLAREFTMTIRRVASARERAARSGVAAD